MKFFTTALLAVALAIVPLSASAKVTGKTSGLKKPLMVKLEKMSRHFGKTVVVTSGCRSHTHNRKVGGAKKSKHLQCIAADVTISGVGKKTILAYWKKTNGGGRGYYCHTSSVHVDIRKESYAWTKGCRKKKKR